MNTTISGIIRAAQLRCQDPNGYVLSHNSPYTAAGDRVALDFLVGVEQNGEIVTSGILHQLTDRGRFLGKVNYASAVADQNRYALPNDLLAIRFVSWKIDTKYELLKWKHMRTIKAIRSYVESGIYPRYWDFGENARIQRATATADAGGGNTLLVDSDVDFTSGSTICYAGDLAINETDDSEATVSSPANGSVTTTALAGGADNTWANGDTYNIVSPHAPLRTLTLDLAPSSADDTGEESLEVVYIGRHYDVLASDVDNNRDWCELPPEMENVAAYLLAAEGWGLKAGPDSTQYRAMTLKAEDEYRKHIANVRDRVDEWLSRWEGGEFPHGYPGGGEITITNTAANYPAYI